MYIPEVTPRIVANNNDPGVSTEDGLNLTKVVRCFPFDITVSSRNEKETNVKKVNTILI